MGAAGSGAGVEDRDDKVMRDPHGKVFIGPEGVKAWATNRGRVKVRAGSKPGIAWCAAVFRARPPRQIHKPPKRFELNASKLRFTPKPRLDLIQGCAMNAGRKVAILVKRGDHLGRLARVTKL